MNIPHKITAVFYHTENTATLEILKYEENGHPDRYYFQIKFLYDQEWDDASNLYDDPLTCANEAYYSFAYSTEKFNGLD